jgi:hypothetical protein
MFYHLISNFKLAENRKGMDFQLLEFPKRNGGRKHVLGNQYRMRNIYLIEEKIKTENA